MIETKVETKVAFYIIFYMASADGIFTITHLLLTEKYNLGKCVVIFTFLSTIYIVPTATGKMGSLGIKVIIGKHLESVLLLISVC